MEYVIAATSRIDPDKVMFMVDRGKCKKGFWSFSLDDAFLYKCKKAAQAKANSLKFNNPHILPLNEAITVALSQQPFDDEADQSWDAHKNTF